MSYINRDNNHSLYYEDVGNPDAQPILFLHGGPGMGCSEKDKLFFDLQIQRVIFLDQRGTGKSLPKGELRANTTEDLVNDIKALLDHLEIDRVILFGGSWGSTLALLFTIAHPAYVECMILRGLFTATRTERKQFENCLYRSSHPNIRKDYLKLVPEEMQEHPSAYYFRQITQLPRSEGLKYSRALNRYGMSLSKIEPIDNSEIEESLDKIDHYNKSRILAHYSLEDFFIPEGYIASSMSRIKHIPIDIVHGRQDLITSVEHAIRFSELHDSVNLHIVEGGHSPFEKAVLNCLRDLILRTA